MRANPLRYCTDLEEMEAKDLQEEANQKTIGLVVQGSKMTGRLFMKVCNAYIRHRKEQRRIKRQNPKNYEMNKPKRVTVKKLVREGAGVSTIESKDDSIREFERIARKINKEHMNNDCERQVVASNLSFLV